MASKQSLSGLRILITNDDGINSHGIKAMERIANSITPDVWIVAPEVGQSGKGYSVTFENSLRMRELSPRKFSVSGTPADCVFVAIGEILKDKKPDLVLSGINHGSNVADFIGLSGTLGAAFASASQNIRAIAVSQHCAKSNELTKFPLPEHFLPSILKKLLSFQWPSRVCMNINFPDVPVGEVAGVRIAKQDTLEVNWSVHRRFDPVDEPYYWLHATYDREKLSDNSDVMLLSKRKCITITALQCKHEFCENIRELEELFAINV
jgi:5'-nucleotidase